MFDHEAFGNTHRYFPLVTKEDYRKKFVNSAIADYYDDSYKSLVSHFAKEEKISVAELKELIEDTVEYFCDDKMISGELTWLVVQTLAAAKLAQLKGECVYKIWMSIFFILL